MTRDSMEEAMTNGPVRSQRGAVLLHVAIAMVALIAFAMFVADYGLMWVSRHQAQNSADAGAMAGAIALAFDDFMDRSVTGPAKTAAHRMAVANDVWNEDPDVNIENDITFPGCPPPWESENSCIRVEVHRDQLRGNPLPMWFGQMVGLQEQGVRAAATAMAAVANASDCVKPWAVPDKWTDVNDVTNPVEAYPPGLWTTDDTYDEVVDGGANDGEPLLNPDIYISPIGPDKENTTGFTVENDLGTRIVLKRANPGQGEIDPIAPGVFYPVDLPRPGDGPITGGDKYRENIATCNGVPIPVPGTLTVENGAMVGPTFQGVQDLIDQDPDAWWDPIAKKVMGSCAFADPPCAARSPRIVAIPIFDPHIYEIGRQTGKVDLAIVNILGFFIEDLQKGGQEVVGYLTTYPGLLMGESAIDPDASFLKSVVLVR